MQNTTTNLPNLKEIEQILWRELQKTYSKVLGDILTGIDEQIAISRDKKRYRLLDKRKITISSLYGDIEIKRNYYRDRAAKEYVFLLDRCLQFDGESGFSPLVEEIAIEFAVTAPSYRKAEGMLETLLGYRVISHETIRQHLMEIVSIPKERELLERPVLFVEVDGLYTKRQGRGKKRRGKEVKIAAVHQGWVTTGKRISLKGKRHYLHDDSKPFWEGFEEFLMDTYHYDPTRHYLIINGDGANWITACRDHFKDRAFFTLDKFHVAKTIRTLFKNHPRYRSIRKALAAYNAERLLIELNSAVGTMEDNQQEEDLEAFINQLEQYPEALTDYRKWLKEKNIDINGLKPMGSAEGTMSVFAKRVKNGRSWVEKGCNAMMTAMVAYLDQMELRTLFGKMERWSENKEEQNPPKHYLESLKSTVGEATRGNIPYLKNKINIPAYRALSGLRAF